MKRRVREDTNLGGEKLSQCSTCTAALCVGNKVFKDLNNNGINDNETGISNVTMYLYRDNNNDNIPDACFCATTITDLNGAYSFCNLLSGNYIVGALIPSGYMKVTNNGGDPDNNIDNDNNGINEQAGVVTGLTISLSLGSEPSLNANNTYDFGFLNGPLCLGNRIWEDINNDGRDYNEPGLANVTVNLYKVIQNNNQPQYGSAIATTTTNANGNYSFCNLFPGEYIIGVNTPINYISSTVKGGDPDNRKDNDNNGMFENGIETRGLAITLTVGGEPDGNVNNTYDFGFKQSINPNNNKNSILIITNESDSNKNYKKLSPVQINKIQSKIYPNPFKSNILFEIWSNENITSKITFIDSKGIEVFNLSHLLSKGNNKFTIDNLDKFASGLYFVKVNLGYDKEYFTSQNNEIEKCENEMVAG